MAQLCMLIWVSVAKHFQGVWYFPFLKNLVMFIHKSDTSFADNVPLVCKINLKFGRNSDSLEKCLFFIL